MKRYYATARYTYKDIDKSLLNSYKIFEIIEDLDLNLYLISEIKEDTKEIITLKLPLLNEKNEEVIFKIGSEKMDTIYQILKSNESEFSESYFSNTRFEEVKFKNEDIKTLKLFDILLDNDNKLWLINKIERATTQLHLIKFPIQEKIITAQINFSEQENLDKIKTIYRGGQA